MYFCIKIQKMSSTLDRYAGFDDINGNQVLTYDFVESLRLEDKKERKKNFIASQRGGQENMLSSNADITIGGGSRGGSKSFSILLDGIYDITNEHFSAVILRKEKPDLSNIIEDSKIVFKDYGTYISSDKDMRWDLKNGGHIRFSYHAGDMDDFKTRFQGKQYSYIAIDEITHIDFDKFKYLMTDLRNAHNIRNRIFGSCNPDHRSWVRAFIDWWIGKADTVYNDPKNNLFGLHPERKGLPIPERDGVVRYCFMAGAKTPADIVWGDSRHDVYLKCKDKIDDLYRKGGYENEGDAENIFVLSVCFTEAKLKENRKLIESDPSYIARLANQDEEQIARDLEGNWDYEAVGDDYISAQQMDDFFTNPRQYGDGIRRASADIAFQGGDNTWMWLRIGNHYEDLAVFQGDSKQTNEFIDRQLKIWGVKQENFCFDSNGVGQAIIGYFPRAVKFNNLEAPYGKTRIEREQASLEFDSIKSQAAFTFGDEIKYREISINPSLLDRRVPIRGGEMMSVREILMQERRIIKIDTLKSENDKGKCLIKKKDMKLIIHRSPDAMESMFYVRIHFIKGDSLRRRANVNGREQIVSPNAASRFRGRIVQGNNISSSRLAQMSFRRRITI